MRSILYELFCTIKPSIPKNLPLHPIPPSPASHIDGQWYGVTEHQFHQSATMRRLWLRALTFWDWSPGRLDIQFHVSSFSIVIFFYLHKIFCSAKTSIFTFLQTVSFGLCVWSPVWILDRNEFWTIDKQLHRRLYLPVYSSGQVLSLHAWQWFWNFVFWILKCGFWTITN